MYSNNLEEVILCHMADVSTGIMAIHYEHGKLAVNANQNSNEMNVVLDHNSAL